MREGDSMKFFTAMLFVVMAVAQTTRHNIQKRRPVLTILSLLHIAKSANF